MNEHEACQLASPKMRAAARAADAVVMAVIQSGMMLVTFFAAVATQDPIRFVGYGPTSSSDENAIGFVSTAVVLMVVASIPAACYEVVATLWRGQTFGKRGGGPSGPVGRSGSYSERSAVP